MTQFEALTAAAFVAFAAAGVEWAVVEAGLGGRLDATNVLARSRVQVLTNVSLEHTELLGETREAIAAEKVAVVPAGRSRGDRRARLGGVCASGAYCQAGDCGRRRTRIRTGRWRTRRSSSRWAARSIPAPMLAVRIPGRMEVRGTAPLEIWDGAHNPAGMRRLVVGAPGPRRGSPLRGRVLDAGREGRRGDGRAPAPGLPDDRRYTIDQFARACSGYTERAHRRAGRAGPGGGSRARPGPGRAVGSGCHLRFAVSSP